ncbi:MAG: DUF5872 domain-containing protein [Candidatus Saccharibacteria bacterium]|nr:DUF5872 domain-containing protein [Candidatus Saccharibacteria bacterium]
MKNDKNSTIRTDPELWEDCKIEAVEKMNGKFSARAMQYAVKLYKERGGDYIGEKQDTNSLKQWTDEKWGYTGEPGHSRYLPLKARQELSPGEKAATSRAKNIGTQQGHQWVAQPENIAKKTSKFRHEKELPES